MDIEQMYEQSFFIEELLTDISNAELDPMDKRNMYVVAHLLMCKTKEDKLLTLFSREELDRIKMLIGKFL